MNAPKRIVCYAINGSGLGHLTRLIAVARWMRRYVTLLDAQPPEILFLTSSDASDVLADAGFAAFKIPSKTVAKKAELNKLEYRRLAKHFVWNTLGVFAPDLFVVDTFPSGSFDELFQVLDGPFKKSFIFRDVKPDYAARPTFRSAIQMYDSVVIPHEPKRVRAALAPQQAAEKQTSNGRIVAGSTTNGMVGTEILAEAKSDAECFGGHHCGEAIQYEREEMLASSTARQQLGVASTHKLIYLSAGGGGDPGAATKLSQWVEALREQQDLHLLVGAGPLFRGPRISGPRITWFESPSIWRYFGAVDAAISAGGYNTFHELLFAQIPTAYYAQPKVADDQAGRLEPAYRSGACRILPADASADDIRQHIRNLLEPTTAAEIRQACAVFLPENGARRCALELITPLYDTALNDVDAKRSKPTGFNTSGHNNAQSRLGWASHLLSPRLVHTLEQIGDGSTGVLADWLVPLMPQGQNNSLTAHPGFAPFVRQLSPTAIREITETLANQDDASDADFETTLCDLLSTIRHAATDSAEASSVTDDESGRFEPLVVSRLADEVLKTLKVTMKKYPFSLHPNDARVSDRSQANWICTIIEGVHDVIRKNGKGLSHTDVLKLFRLFPQIIDLDVLEVTRVFDTFLETRLESDSSAADMMHSLQAFKLSHPKVTHDCIRQWLTGVRA